MYVEYMDEKSEPNNNEVSQSYFHSSLSGILCVFTVFRQIIFITAAKIDD